MRRKIWASASNLPRVIELNKGCFIDTTGSVGASFAQEHMRMAASSGKAPAVLEVCRESRDEALRIYKLVQFNYNIEVNGRLVPEMCFYPKIWYNKDADIIYLGSGSCVGTLMMLLHTDIDLTRVAISMDDYKHTDRTCIWEEDLSHTPFQGMKPFLGPQIDHITRYLRVLHGFEPTGTLLEKAFPGCKTLREVFFLVKPAIVYPDIKHIDESVGIEKIIDSDGSRGVTKFSLEENIKGKLASALQVVGAKKWVGENEPNFNVSRLYFLKSAKRKADVMALHINNRMMHRMMWSMARQLMDECTIYPTTRDYPGSGDYLFRFQGTEERIDKLIERLKLERVKAEKLFKTEVLVVDPTIAVCPSSEDSNALSGAVSSQLGH
jgi:hypothetical protein